MLSGNGRITTVAATSMKSILGQDALFLAKRLHKDIPTVVERAPVFVVRNAAAHMALVDADELHQAVKQMVRIIDFLLERLDLRKESFWGQNGASVADALLDETKTELAQAIQAKTAAAQQRFDELVGDLGPRERKALLHVLSGRRTDRSDHDEEHQCPVCAQMGWLQCYVSDEAEYDEDGPTRAYKLGTPYIFTCPVCELLLADDELLAFPFPREFEIENGSDEWEPDEDYYRDR
jgi:hypothetical protein